MNLPITVGMRVNTKFGLATVLGFERFDDRGMRSELVHYERRGRVCVQLDHPERWSLSAPGIHPYMWRSDLIEFNQEITP